MYRKVSEVGFKYKSRLSVILPGIWWEAHVREYAQTRAKFGWPEWPLHVAWLGWLLASLWSG
jgi:hypothetical protein